LEERGRAPEQKKKGKKKTGENCQGRVEKSQRMKGRMSGVCQRWEREKYEDISPVREYTQRKKRPRPQGRERGNKRKDQKVTQPPKKPKNPTADHRKNTKGKISFGEKEKKGGQTKKTENNFPFRTHYLKGPRRAKIPGSPQINQKGSSKKSGQGRGLEGGRAVPEQRDDQGAKRSETVRRQKGLRRGRTDGAVKDGKGDFRDKTERDLHG